MRESQRLELRQTELRAAIADFPADGDENDLQKLTAEYRSNDIRLGAAIISEQTDDAAQAAAGELDPKSPEQRDFDKMVDAANVTDYVAETVFGRTLAGASAELRKEVFGDDETEFQMPLDVLASPQMRADAASGPYTAIQDNQMPIAARVFGRTAADWLGVGTSTVPVGSTSYVHISGVTTADVRSDGVGLDAAALTLVTKEINPVRMTAAYLFNIEDSARIRGLEDSMQRDLRAVIADKRDTVILQGQAAVAGVSPAVDGIISTLTDPTNPSAVADYADYLAIFDDVDEYSEDGSNIRLLVNADTFKQARGLTVGANANGGLLRDRAEMGPMRFRHSVNLPATASDIATAISYKSGHRGFVSPVWRGVNLIRDIYGSNASEGRIRLTLQMLVGFAQVEHGANVYRRHEFKVA